jgi:ABC-type glycerol-3-phosphate transport system permease component
MTTRAGQKTNGASGSLSKGERFNGRRAVWLTLLWLMNALFLFFFLFPFYWQTVTALKPSSELYAQPVTWFPSRLDFSHFQTVFTLFHFQENIRNSLIVATATTVVSVAVGTLGAYALARLPLPAKRTILVLVVTMVTFPGIALVASLFIFLRGLSLIDTYWALIIPYVAFSLPFAIWVLTNFFRDIPADLAEQAEVDGCTPFQSLYRVILPLATPGLVTAGLLIFIGAWNEFLFAYTFTSNNTTIPVAIFSFGGIHEIPWGEISAGSEMVTLPIIALVLIFQRRIVQGLTAGALKG